MPSITLPYKHDPSAGPIPAHIHYASPTSGSPHSSTTPKSIVIIFHAGGFAGGSTSLIPSSQVTYLVEKLDVVVVTPEYRLCPQVSLLDGPIADAHDCLAWAREKLPEALEKETGGKVTVDKERVGVMGHSAGGLLAMELGNAPNPPRAILDFYGVKYLADPFWSQPLASFAGVPDADQKFLAKVFEGDVPVAAPPMFVNGKPDLKTPRSAWMISAMKHGRLYTACLAGPKSASGIDPVADPETFAVVEPTRGFASKKWPPTCFVHGTEDVFAPMRLTERAEREVKEAGVEAELITVQGAGHIFDLALKEGDAGFDGPVVKALKWLVERV